MVMAEKRKIRQSTRARGESLLRKGLNSPSPPRQIEPLEEGLPYKLKDDQDLPILSRPQDKDLCPTEYQSIAERLEVILAISLVVPSTNNS